MKIAFLTSRFPHPLDKGDKLRAFYHLVELSRYHEIHLISLTESPIEDDQKELLYKYCRTIECIPLSPQRSVTRLLPHMMGELPLQVAYFYQEDIKRHIHEYIDLLAPEHIYVQLIRMAPYVVDLPHPKSIDYMDSIPLNMQALGMPQLSKVPFLNGIELKRVKAYESKIFDKFYHHFVISERDKREFDPAVRDQLTIVPNGVNTDFFVPNIEIAKEFEIVFVGNLGYVHNDKAAHYIIDEIVPRLRSDVHVLIAGANPSKWLNIKQQHNVRVKGWTEDVRDYYQQGQMLVAPIFTGSGQQNKILEAMAQGVPCVTTSFVNESIGAEPGEDILIADDPKTFINAIETILGDESLRLQLSLRGRKFVMDHYSWSETTAPIIDAIERG